MIEMILAWLIIFASYHSLTDGCGKLLLARQKDATQYRFSTNARNTGLENEHNPQANTYMIIGELTQPTRYKLYDGKYLFRLEYLSMDGTSTTHVTWKQSSWLTSSTIIGYEVIDVPPEPNAGTMSDFEGLGKSSNECTYLDGDGNKHLHWYNAVGSNCAWEGGTPGFDGQPAKSMALYIYSPIGCGNFGDDRSQILLARHKDATESLFSAESRNTGIENENNPEQNTHMIIGQISNPSIYQLSDGKYLFYLQYITNNDKVYHLKWKQSSWLTESSITGFEPIDMPPHPNDDAGSDFEGLGKSSTSCTYLDGDGYGSGLWFNAVGTNYAGNCNGWGGSSPGYNKEPAIFTALYIYNPSWTSDKSECYAVDLKRVAILVTGDQQVDNMENWGITDNGFTMTLKSNFASTEWPQWTECTCKIPAEGQFVNSQDQPCVVPTGTHIPGYDCYMKDFPTIYLTESQMNEGLLVDVYGEIGENNDAVIWDYEFRFTEWKADDVKNGVKESWATRTGSNGRRARHFFKYTYTDNSNCNLNVNEFFDCE